MPVSDPKAAMEMITRVADRLDMRVLVGSGWSEWRAPEGAGDRIRVARGVLNFDQVLPRCAVAVHHGGAGTGGTPRPFPASLSVPSPNTTGQPEVRTTRTGRSAASPWRTTISG